MRYILIFLLMYLCAGVVLADLPELQPKNAVEQGAMIDIQWRPDYEIAAVTTHTGLWIYDAEIETLLASADKTSHYVAWSADGARLAVYNIYASDNPVCDINIYDVALDGTALELSHSLEGCFFTVNWSSDGRYLVLGTYKVGVQILSTETYELVKTYSEFGDYAAVSPDSQFIAINPEWSDDNMISIIDLDSDQIVLEISQDTPVFEPSWSYDGRYISAQCIKISEEGKKIGHCIWSAETGDLIYSKANTSIRWNPIDDQFLANEYHYENNTYSHTISVYETENSAPIFTQDIDQIVRDVFWYPDGNRVLLLTATLTKNED